MVSNNNTVTPAEAGPVAIATRNADAAVPAQHASISPLPPFATPHQGMVGTGARHGARAWGMGWLIAKDRPVVTGLPSAM